MDQLSLKQRLVDPLLAEQLQRDVTLVCDDNIPRRYHQCLLASYSPFLKNLLAERACCSCKSATCGGMTEVVIVLDGFKGEVLMNLMMYIYTGECKVKNRKMILDMIELKKGLGIDVDIDFSVNKNKPSAVENNVSDDASTRAGQKRVTIAIMSAIEQVNSGVSKLLCSECDQCLNKDTFMLHYRNHMQAYAQQQTSPPAPTAKKCKVCGAEVVEELFAEHVAKHANDSNDDIQVENFSEFLKNKFSMKNIVKTEPLDTDVKPPSNAGDEGLDDDAETVMQSHGDQEPRINIDMQEYEKLLRSSIHTLIVSRKRKKAKALKEPENGLVLVSQQEIDEEILKNPRNKEEEYGRLKIRNVYRKLYDRKQKLKPKDKSDKMPIVVTDEEVQDEIDKENEARTVKINLDVRRIKATRTKSDTNSPQSLTNISSTPGHSEFIVPSTPTRKRKSLTTPRKPLTTPRKSITTPRKSLSKLNIDESERKKIYHRLYVRKWNQNQTEGLTTPIHISDEEIMREFSSHT